MVSIPSIKLGASELVLLCFPSIFLFLLLFVLFSQVSVLLSLVTEHKEPLGSSEGPHWSREKLKSKVVLLWNSFWPLPEVFCLSDTMKEQFISHRRLWVSGIEALLSIVPWFLHLDPSLQRVGRAVWSEDGGKLEKRWLFSLE